MTEKIEEAKKEVEERKFSLELKDQFNKVYAEVLAKKEDLVLSVMSS